MYEMEWEEPWRPEVLWIQRAVIEDPETFERYECKWWSEKPMCCRFKVVRYFDPEDHEHSMKTIPDEEACPWDAFSPEEIQEWDEDDIILTAQEYVAEMRTKYQLW